MSLISPSLAGCTFSATITQASVSPYKNTSALNVPLNFSDVANLKVITGSYSPSNNTQTIISGLSAISPNFLIFICDGIANLFTDSGFLTTSPVNKFAMLTMPPIVGGANPIGVIGLDGRAANPYPMIQNSQLNYTLIIGQATVA